MDLSPKVIDTKRLARYIPCKEENIGDPDVVFAHVKIGDDVREGRGNDCVF